MSFNKLSVARVMRHMTAPICECADSGKVTNSTISTMIDAELFIAIDEETGDVTIELPQKSYLIMRQKLGIEEAAELIGGKGPFFTPHGAAPNVTFKATISATEMIKIWTDTNEKIDVSKIQRGLQAVAAAA